MWKDFPSAKMASGYIQAYRIASEVIKAKGDNKFLGVGGTSFWVWVVVVPHMLEYEQTSRRILLEVA